MQTRPSFSPCEITLKFADGDYLFRLPVKQIAELQSKTGIGIGGLFARVLKGRVTVGAATDRTFGMPTMAEYRLDDLRETIRLGLIGGGSGTVNGEPVTVSPGRAVELVETYVDGRPLKEAWDLAVAILMACIEGYADSDAPSKKAQAAENETAG